MNQPNKRFKKENNSSLPIVIGVIVAMLTLAGTGWFFFYTPSGKPPVSVETPLVEPIPTPQSKVEESEKSSPVAQQAPIVKEKSECELTSEEIRNFFSHLDQQEYIASLKFKGGSHTHFSRLIDKLIANPPVIFQETESLFSILNNTAHFYRTLRKDDVFLIKEILQKEGESLESVMALFYRWSELAPQCENSNIQVHLPLAGLYEYAGFFINTLGGQSYLFRRESRVRMLIKYYSILILDRANENAINRFGIDIRPAIDSLLSEMQGTTNLSAKDDYLAKLILLQDKYGQQYGAANVEIPEGK